MADQLDDDTNECWFDGADELLNGTVTLENYTETIDSNNGTLFEIGFGSIGGLPGGVIFNLTISETVEGQAGFTISPEDVIVLSGGFALIIQAP